MSSNHAEDTCYRFICELGGGAPRAEKGTDDREQDDEKKLGPREERLHVRVQEQVKLQQHSVADDRTDQDAERARAEDKNE